MNSYGYSPYGMYGGGSPYMGYGMNQNMQQNNNQNMQPEQQSFADHLRTCISGLSAITGISYGISTLFGVLVKTIKFLNIFKGRSETNKLLHQVWNQTVRRHRRSSFLNFLKYLALGIIVVGQFALYYMIHRKRKTAEVEACKEQEEVKLVQEDPENEEISLEDFMFNKKFGEYLAYVILFVS